MRIPRLHRALASVLLLVPTIALAAPLRQDPLLATTPSRTPLDGLADASDSTLLNRGAANPLALFEPVTSPTRSALQSTLHRRQDDDKTPEKPLHLPFVGTPYGDWYKSSKEPPILCETLRIQFGGGAGAPYEVNVVNASTLNADRNQTLEDVQVLERIGLMGMPGLTWWDLDSSDIEVGTPVAMQVIDGVGNIGYSASRHVSGAHLNEFCHYPGAFWPPSRWDSTHFIVMLLAVFLLVPVSAAVYSTTIDYLRKHPLSLPSLSLPSFRFPRRSARQTDVPLQERHRSDGATHVLGDDDERTSLEEEDRPLLRGDGDGPIPSTAPPGYEEAIKEDWRDEAAPAGQAGDGEEGRRV
ncbi:hypothetical protein JCM10207_002346 [Rhodosporidiobolus poonsookiae]